MFEPKVSVIIPIFNSAKFLNNAIDSVLSFKEVGEIILIEDGSTDNSYDLCLKYQNEFDRIKVLYHYNHQNRGAGISRNLGIKNSKFPIISFLDSDDIYFTNRFEESLKILIDNPFVDACFGRVLKRFQFSGNEKVIGFLKKKENESVLTYLFKGGYFHTNSITVRKDFFTKSGFFDQNCWPHEDVELWIRMAFVGNLVGIESNDPVATYNIHGENLSNVSTWDSKFVFWKKVFINFFFKQIGFYNRVNILKQLIKCFVYR